MKSNEERVKSIMNKAKRYKSERGAIISTSAVVICAVIAIALHGSLQKGPDMIIESGENSNVVDTFEEKGVLTFASKDELIQKFKEQEKKFEGRRGIYYETSDLAVKEADMKASPFAQNAVADDLSSDKSYSNTNVQVQGVDEADIIKTNGDKIFYINNIDNKLEVFNTNGEKIELGKEVKFDEKIRPYEMYIDDKYIVVLANSDIVLNNIDADNDLKVYNTTFAKYYRYKNSTKAFIYDINSYELLREVEIEGNSVSSRKVGDDIYIITNKYISFYNDFDSGEVLPLYKDTCVSNELSEVDIANVKYFSDFENDEECNYMIITSFSLDDMNSKVNINTYLGAGSEVYCSTENLYVAKVNYNYTNGLMRMMVDSIGTSKDSSYTNIHKFMIKNGDIKHVATGKVPGRLLNQFSMDEYDGNFRITTTLDSAGNNLYVLDKDMKEVGKLEKLASGERIYATRFMGDKAYVVTYKTVDPLFVIDLSNPISPRVLGELKIPGYSSYLHPFGENYLIGFGEDSVEKSYLNWEGKNEVVAYSNGLKMAIFDVTDYSNPKEIYSIKIGARGSYSELLYNHKAFLLNEEEGFVAFPASITNEAGNYDDGTPRYGNTIFSGALVYNISVEDGISLRGKIQHPGNKYNKLGETIERIIYIGDKLYTVSDNMIAASDMESIEMIDSLEF